MSTYRAKLQKMHERIHVKYFLDTDIGKAFLKGNDIILVETPLDGCEPLDFIAHAKDGKKIGIEATGIVLFSDNHFGSIIDSNLNAVLEQMHKNLRNIFTIAAYYPNPINPSSKLLSKKDLKELFANKIRAFDNDYTNGNVGKDRFEHINVGGDNEILLRFNIHEKYFYTTSSAGGSYIINPYSELQDCILRKEKKHESYLHKCDECIMLVVSDYFMSKSSPILFEDLEKQVFESSFSQVFLLELGGDIPIKTTKLFLGSTA